MADSEVAKIEKLAVGGKNKDGKRRTANCEWRQNFYFAPHAAAMEKNVLHSLCLGGDSQSFVEQSQPLQRRRFSC